MGVDVLVGVGIGVDVLVGVGVGVDVLVGVGVGVDVLVGVIVGVGVDVLVGVGVGVGFTQPIKLPIIYVILLVGFVVLIEKISIKLTLSETLTNPPYDIYVNSELLVVILYVCFNIFPKPSLLT